MSRRRTPTPRPLPPREGVPAARVRMPRDGTWPTVAHFLTERVVRHGSTPTERVVRHGSTPTEHVIGRSGLQRWLESVQAVLDDGTHVTLTTPYRAGEAVHLYREAPEEVPVPGEMPVLYRDENIVVVDKPHFLATMPRGGHVRQTAVLRLRAELDLPDLVPAHRLDRLTAGVLMLIARPQVRSDYQALFAHREVSKTYLAVAPLRADLTLPRTVRSRILKERGSLQAVEVSGEANAVTRIELARELEDGRGLYRLSPTTGRTHQLRVHLSSLGIPIENDPLYPVVRDVEGGDFSRPLRLVAHQLSFIDPLTVTPRTFTSSRTP